MQDIANQYTLWRIIQPLILEALHRTHMCQDLEIVSDSYFEGTLFSEHIFLKEKFEPKIFHSNTYPSFCYKEEVAGFKIYMTYKKRIVDYTFKLVLSKENELQFVADDEKFPFLIGPNLEYKKILPIYEYDEVIRGIFRGISSLSINRGGGD